MPDLFSHIMLALIICEFAKVKKKSLVIIGAVIPDVLSKWASLISIYNLNVSILYKLLFPFHMPLGSFIVLSIAMLVFDYNYKSSIKLGSIGLASHFFMDVLQVNTNFGETLLFFPLSWHNYSIGLVQIYHWYYLAAILLVAYLVLVLFKTHLLRK